MNGPLMNLILMGQVKTGEGGYSIVFNLALLTDYRDSWWRIKDRGYGTLMEAVDRSNANRYWLEGRNYT